MCISATVLAAASLATAAVGTAMTISSANAQASAEQERLKLERQQQMQQMEMERIQAMEAEAQRQEDFRRQRAANMAALASMGVGQSMSFDQGIAEAEERALRLDLSNIRLGLLGAENRLVDNIRINKLNSAIVSTNRKAAVLGAGIGFANSAINTASYYQTYKTPGSGGIDAGLQQRTFDNNTAALRTQFKRG